MLLSLLHWANYLGVVGEYQHLVRRNMNLWLVCILSHGVGVWKLKATLDWEGIGLGLRVETIY